MSLDGEPSGARSDMTGFQKFFASTTCSDIKVVLPFENGVVDAHKVVLAAGSGCFHRKFKQAEAQGENIREWQVEGDLCSGAVRDAIQYMYGLELPARYKMERSWALRCYAELGAVAEKYEICGLYDLAFKAASGAMVDSLDDHGALKAMLDRSVFQTPESVRCAYDYNFGVRVIWEQLTQLHRKKAFCDLLRCEPRLAAILFDFLVDEKDGLKTNNDINFKEYEGYA